MPTFIDRYTPDVEGLMEHRALLMPRGTNILKTRARDGEVERFTLVQCGPSDAATYLVDIQEPASIEMPDGELGEFTTGEDDVRVNQLLAEVQLGRDYEIDSDEMRLDSGIILPAATFVVRHVASLTVVIEPQL